MSIPTEWQIRRGYFCSLHNEMARVIGDDAVFALCRHFGGRPIYIRKHVVEASRAPSPIEQVIGTEAYESLALEFGGSKYLHFNSGPYSAAAERSVTIVEKRRAGQSITSIAAELRCAIGTVKKTCNRYGLPKGRAVRTEFEGTSKPAEAVCDAGRLPTTKPAATALPDRSAGKRREA